MKIHQYPVIFAVCAAFLQCFILPLHAQNSSLVFPGSDNEVYISWLAKATYDKSAFLSSTSSQEGEGVAIHWSIEGSMFHLAVVARATGWAAFGLAESGSMKGADIIMYTAETNTLVDSHVLDQLVKPIPDDCQSWELVNSLVDVEEGFIIFEAKRLLDTGDKQDRTIIDDSELSISPQRVIASWGNTSEPSYHARSTARDSVRFFSTSDVTDEVELFAQSMATEAEGNFSFTAKDFVIPSDVVTTYQRFCISRDELLGQNVPIGEDLHTIGIEPLIDPRGKKYVHHFILTGSSQQWNSSLNCDEYPALETAYSWAPGDLPLILPSNIGSPLGISGFQSFSIEIHYNNVDLDANVSDSSGIRAYYTSIKREFDLGIFQLGDPGIAFLGQPVSPDGGLAQHTFACGSQCLDTYLNEPVTVIREHLHMHKTGVSMVNYHIRNEKVVREGKADFFDYSAQGLQAVVQAPFQMYPGDAFRTICNFNATNSVLWGLATAEEMCIAFLYYYPRKLTPEQLPLLCGASIGDIIPGCNATYTLKQDFPSDTQLERTFGGAPASCPNVGANTTSAPNSSPINSTSASNSIISNLFSFTLFGSVLWSSTIALM
jgi:Copper type II ascorbate-dependent monooxygenase, C-terminal domain/DOMON domain/Copper type II ascorbate-dependent monooxygenase, N-terminal domain